IAIDPSNPTTVYLGTGETNNSPDSYYGTGLYKSIDGGIHWTLMTGLGNEDLHVTGFQPGSTFTLSYNGASTTPLPVRPTAAQIQNALNALPTIGGAGGATVVVATGGVDEDQTITLTEYTAGTFRLSFNGATTGPISAD